MKSADKDSLKKVKGGIFGFNMGKEDDKKMGKEEEKKMRPGEDVAKPKSGKIEDIK